MTEESLPAYPDMSAIFFIYVKGDQYRFLSTTQAIASDPALTRDGWQHRATVDPASYIEGIRNQEPTDGVIRFRR
jgi:hypothetical protein